MAPPLVDQPDVSASLEATTKALADSEGAESHEHGMVPSTETSGLQANAASDAARSHVVRRPPVVSIYSAWRDRFVRVDEDGTLHADVEYPWSERSWFSILRLSSNMSIASPHDDWPRHSGPGRRLEQLMPLLKPPSLMLQVAAKVTGPRAGSADADLAELSTPGTEANDGADGDEVQQAEEELGDELWRGDDLHGDWFALASVKNGRLLRLHGADSGGAAWVAKADLPPPSARQLSIAAAAAGAADDALSAGGANNVGGDAKAGRHRAAARRSGKRGPWVAPPGAVWRLEGDRLRNRGTGGVLNVRPGGSLRGHGNSGPPWRIAEGLESETSSTVALRAVPRQLRESTSLLPSAGRRTPRQYSLLSVDYHIATAQDVGHTLRELGQRFVEKSLSGACARRRTCAAPYELPSLTREAAFTLCPRPHATRRAAYEALRDSPLLAGADGVVCSHPAALCEVWLPFNKSILLIVTANLELARENAERWKEWLQTVVAFSHAPRVVVAANNRYDQAYVEHFTGVRPLYLPTLANYITARYRPLPGKPVLLARSHHALGRKLLSDLRRASREHRGLRVSSIEEAYPGNANGGGYEYTQLASHPAIVVVPYTKSTMTFFELYRMGIPIFVPSLELLVRWELQRHVMSERVYWRHAPSPLRRPSTPNPNSLQDPTALEHWIRLSDPYVYPHVQYFDSADDLAVKLASVDLRDVSARMQRHSAEMQPVMRQKWRAVLRKLFHGRPSGSWPCGEAGGFDAALQSRFGLTLSASEPDCTRNSAPDLGQWN